MGRKASSPASIGIVALPGMMLGNNIPEGGGKEGFFRRRPMVRALHNDCNRRPAVVTVMTVVLLGVILGFAALTVDLGVVFNTRHDLQNAADSAALSGVSAYALEDMLDLREGTASISAFNEVQYTARRRAIDIASRALVIGTHGITLNPADVTLGWLDYMSPTAEFTTGVPQASFNAVRVVTRRTKESDNGPAEMFMSRIFGVSTVDVTATATAVFERSRPDIDLWPFTMSKTQYEIELDTGGDNYDYDEDMDEVGQRFDGVSEVHLFPNSEAPGNFGSLAFGPSSSTDVLSDFIREGVSEPLLEEAFGNGFPTFVDEYGEPTTYTMTGDPGMSWSIRTDVDDRIGDVVVIFLHDGVVQHQGSNATFTIVEARHVRVMGVDYDNKGFWVQPVEATDSALDLIGKAVLAR
jgi:hypothetical protein